MTNNEILAAIHSNVKNGHYIQFTKIKPLANNVVKETKMRIRMGVSYANMQINEGRQTGSLPWGHWVEGLENLVIEHKGNYYLRISSIDPQHPESGADIIETKYLQNNEVIDRNLGKMLGEEKASKASAVYNIKFENIVNIGG